MAAKPPKPPGNFLNRFKSNSKNSSNTAASDANFNNNNHNNNSSSSNSSDSGHSEEATTNISVRCPLEEEEEEVSGVNASTSAVSAAATDVHKTATAASTRSTRNTCNCTNISIMHLFHEMKQEFPTIPDTIVAQCVNDNCHQKDNCLLLLRKELALNPTSAQSYPGKVLHPQPQQPQQHQQRKSPTTPSRPTRVAPPLPCKAAANSGPNNNNNNNSNINNKNNNNSSSSGSERQPSPPPATTIDPCVCGGNGDMPAVTTATTTPTRADAPLEGAAAQHIGRPRARPTTLDLQQVHDQQAQQQQAQNPVLLQRQHLKSQLQQHFQQRLQQKHQQPQPQPQLVPPTTAHKAGATRRAPLPPLPPKPVQLSASVQIQQHPLQAPHLPSPLSADESELSVNVSVSSPTHAGGRQIKSPIRHRSVITLQPDLPYSRDFPLSPTPTSSGGGTPTSSSGSQKSFTSINLTLRQPNVTGGPQSTVDVTAGPGLSSGGGSGLSYSSASYDARRGYHKNFHITLTDEGGVFHASRIRPRSCVYPSEPEVDSPTNDGHPAAVNPLRATASEQSVLQSPESPHRAHQQFLQGYPAASGTSMCLTVKSATTAAESNTDAEVDADDFTDGTLRRQKACRDKLAAALRENKRKLGQVEGEINVLTEPVNLDESERLDIEIQKLRSSCETMLNAIENARREAAAVDTHTSYANINGSNTAQQGPYSYSYPHPNPNQPQPFPRQRQRPPRPPPPLVTRPLEFTQHPQRHQPQHQHGQNSPSGTSAATSPLSVYEQQRFMTSTDEDEYSDSTTDGGEEDDEPLEMWSCSMCTFRNHPQLNICECCDCVRILPESVLSREDIHITLSPGENRIIHSWIVS